MASFLDRLRAAFGTRPQQKKVASSKEKVAEKKTPSLPKGAEPVKEKPAKKQKPVKSAQAVQFEQEAKDLLSQAREEVAALRAEATAEHHRLSQEAEVIRRRALEKEAEVSRKIGALEERERVLESRGKQIDQRLGEVEELKQKHVEKLEHLASLKKEEARQLIMDGVEKRLAESIARRIQEAEEEIKSQAEEKTKEILADAMQRGATDYVVEYTVSTVKLADEELKGRIIGREGRNIRAFEQVSGVEIELDESNEVLLSSFDPVRREIARRSLEKLVKDRRIRPSLIEEVVAKTKTEMDKILFEEGQKLCHKVGVYRLPPELVQLLGRYKFRFSYGQNLVAHTMEVVKIGVAVAQEIGADVNVVRLGCLLHDIGKVMMDEEGSHVDLGVTAAKKYSLPAGVIECIAEHHEDKPFSTPESRVVWVADAISGARPGARYESHEEYVKRMRDIEEVGAQFAGVEAVYAYQAGRDVRVMVKPDQVSDDELVVLAQKIRDQLEEKVSYVGQVKVTCIRERRVSETTRGK